MKQKIERTNINIDCVENIWGPRSLNRKYQVYTQVPHSRPALALFEATEYAITDL